MAIKKAVQIIMIAVLGLSLLGGCKPKEQLEQASAQEADSSKEQELISSELVKEAVSLEDLYYYRENFSAFVQKGDKEALLSLGEDAQIYKVGQDIEEGEYMAVCNHDTFAGNITVTKDGDPDANEYLNMDTFYINTIFKVKNGEYVSARLVNIYPIKSKFKVPMQGEAYLPGMFKVGEHIPVGEYLGIGDYVSAYVFSEPYSNAGKEVYYISGDKMRFFTVKEGQYLRTDNCMLYPIAKAPNFIKTQKTFGHGMYKIGVTIPAGNYTARTSKDLAIITMYKDSLNNDDSMMGMIYVEPEIDITLIEGQYVDVQYAELRQSIGGPTGSVAIIEKGPDIVFDENIEPVLAAPKDGEANYKVGKDIAPGEYMAIADNSNFYVEITDDSGDIIYNGGNNCTIFKLNEGENLTIKYCKVYDINHVPSVPKKGEGYLTGRYKVGTHIPEGEYMAIGKSIYVDVYSDDSWDYNAQIGDLTSTNYGIITLQADQYLELAGDAMLYPIDLGPPVELLDGAFRAGMYKVGVHIPAGVYECSAIGTDGYVIINKDSKNNRNSEISTTKIKGKEQITVTNGQYIKVYGAVLILKEKKEKNESL